ncbi:MAG: guanylate kinase [Deltaproteobacteria bacterium]|nr:guanylate kinase [Deltaproteobacteria bacterium]MBW2253502.1 guanylate kinase [Deltaproteobacteria bacterium]
MPGWRLPDEGVLFVVSGPSGVGKSTLVQAAMATIPGLSFSVSATTRTPREGERDGVHYHFLSRERFDTLVARGAFLEHATVYHQAYGTLMEPTREALSSGRSLLLDIDVQGSRQVRAGWAAAVHVLIVPPELEALESRLRARDTDPEEVVRQRMAQVAEQVGAIAEYDYVVINDDLDTAHRAFQAILLAEMSRVRRRASLVSDIERALEDRGETG